jgi:glutamine cyclotransferase
MIRTWHRVVSGLRLLLVHLLLGAGVASAAECPAATPLRFEIAGTISRSELGFTQGLEFRDGKLYESTGRVDGTTRVNTIDAAGQVTRLVELGTRVFGEGLTILNDEIVQLTWQDHAVYVYDLGGKPLRQMTNPREGWGLTNDGKQLIFSDGEDAIYFADPKTFAITRTTRIKSTGTEKILGLNELELVNDKLYGNLFTTRLIVRLDPASGCIEAVADLSVLWNAMPQDERQRIGNPDYVLNGIAYDRKTELFYLTGKRWKTIFFGRFAAGQGR